MDFKISVILSFTLHLLGYGLYFLYSEYFFSQSKLSILIQKGETQNYPVGLIAFQFQGKGETNINQYQSALEGAESEEIKNIQNKITYPPVALENGWESNCEWSVEIGKENKAIRVHPINKCKYQVFENEFMRVIRNWNFTLQEGTVLKIPVAFRIQSVK
ncbi:MAG: energy transducer TonB [Leptospiraceae bacterium]|nr:hypothetical protein [Leptospiraceae bacterium]MCK6381965.1 energy transducer TonB [Leptospiraceae bacterium]NUM40303.1 hypothetical protein [Leptospiraceae bacterium]